jgi:hypothetical protein
MAAPADTRLEAEESVERFGYHQELRRRLTFRDLVVYGLIFMVPMAGSVYTYAGRGVHPAVGFIAGWQILLDYVLVPALLYVVGAVALHSFVSEVPVWLWVLIFVVVNTVVNTLGIQFTARFNIYMLIAISVLRHYGMGRAGGRVDPWRHLIAPAIGAAIIVYVMIKADVAAKTVGLIWLGLGIAVLAAFYATGRPPALGGLDDSPSPSPADAG